MKCVSFKAICLSPLLIDARQNIFIFNFAHTMFYCQIYRPHLSWQLKLVTYIVIVIFWCFQDQGRWFKQKLQCY